MLGSFKNKEVSVASSVYDFKVKDISGKDKSLSDYKGKVLLIVNVASQCGLTPQYKGLQELHEKYASKGLAILGFPANDFGAQEPGTEGEIKTFCETKFGVTFPMFSKISVKNPHKDPLYKYLTEDAPGASEIKWNFHKFLVDRSGHVVANIDPKTEPEALSSQIDSLL